MADLSADERAALDGIALPSDLNTPAERRASALAFVRKLRRRAEDLPWWVPGLGKIRALLRATATYIESLAAIL